MVNLKPTKKNCVGSVWSGRLSTAVSTARSPTTPRTISSGSSVHSGNAAVSGIIAALTAEDIRCSFPEISPAGPRAPHLQKAKLVAIFRSLDNYHVQALPTKL